MTAKMALAALLCVLPVLPAAAQMPVDEFVRAGGVTGAEAIAGRWLDWAVNAIAEGRWAEARAALERARDYAASSSDLSYCLAFVLMRQNAPAREVLAPARQAIETGRWTRYSENCARLVEAEILIRLREYDAALRSLSRVDPVSPDSYRAGAAPRGSSGVPAAAAGAQTGGARTAASYPPLSERVAERAAVLRLRALLETGDRAAFRREMVFSLDRYPREPEIIAVFFDYASRKTPERADTAIMETCLRRAVLFAGDAPDLAWKAASFIRDTAEARRLVEAGRAGPEGPGPASIPAALNLGVIDDGTAVAELFDPRNTILSRALLAGVYDLLRGEEARETFRRNLEGYSGEVIFDGDGDGYAESAAFYRAGQMIRFVFDRNQDGEPLWDVTFAGGAPVRARVALFGESRPARAAGSGAERGTAELVWEIYPALREARVGNMILRFRPLEFSLPLLEFREFGGSGAFMLADAREEQGPFSERLLVMAAESLERPSAEFPGGTEIVQLSRGIPLAGAELFEGRVVSVTEYEGGRKRLERIDLDLDGRMETVRRFRREYPARPGEGDPFLFDLPGVPESSESDWDGDGIAETGEVYRAGGSALRSWDFNRDGLQDYTEEGSR